MIPLDLPQITEEDILDFYQTHRVGESTFDYKAQLGNLAAKAQDKYEFLKDITSFANAEGGDFIIGIDQKGEKADGIKVDNEDVLMSQLEQIIRDNITPRLPVHPKIQFVPLRNGNKILVIRVGKSYIGPHRIYQVGKDFWSRGINGKFSLDVPQLRRMFVASENIRQEISGFILSRTSQILAGASPVTVSAALPKMVLHLIPVQAFADGQRLDFYRMYENVRELATLQADIADSTVINFNGLVKYSTYDGEVKSYSQVFYSGSLECVATELVGQELPDGQSGSSIYFLADRFAVTLFKVIPEFFQYLEKIGVQYPVMMHLQIQNVRGVQFLKTWQGSVTHVTKRELRESSLVFPEIVVHKRPSLIAKVLRPWIDLVWRAFGFVGCKNYDSDGAYVEAPGPGPQGRKWL